MNAVVIESPGQLAVIDVPEPVPLARQVVVEVAACGVCGSDVRYLHGDNPWASQTLGTKKPNPPNMVLGHELAGTIVEAGSEEHRGRIGQRVGVLAYRGCRQCHYCQTGRHHLCGRVEHIGHAAGWPQGQPNPGGMAERCRVWAEMAYPIPDAISFEEACLLDGLAVAIHACDVGRISAGDRVCIIGSGAVGLLILQVALQREAGYVLCLDTCAKPIEAALELGAHVALFADGVLGDDLWRDTFDVVFDTVGSPETLVESLALLRRGGRAVLMAHPSERVELDSCLFTGERSVTTSCNNPYADYPTAIEWMASGRVRVAPLITHRIAIEQAHEAFAVAEAKETHGAIKVLVSP